MVFKCLSLKIDNNILPTLSSCYRLQGRVAIITGGASGIGASAAQLFHKNGAKVVIADVQDNLGQALADKLGCQDVCYIHCDVSNEREVINLVDTTVAKFGKLDILVNSGCNLEYRGFVSILDTPKSDLERVLAVNAIGGFLVAKHAARVMVPRRRGCILYTTGTGATACTEIKGLCNTPANCGVSKFGILGLVKSLAADLGQYGIKVDCVSPTYGLAMTEAIASIANAALFSMATDDISHVGAKHAARVMVPQHKGCILFTASACTETAGLGSPAYAVSKYGIVGLVKCLAAELGQLGVRVNCISPYGVVIRISDLFDRVDPTVMEAQLSEMGNLKGQVLKTEGIANAAIYLASDEANYVNGINLVVDGGYSVVNPTIMNIFNDNNK